MLNGFDGKLAVVTGGGSGMGRELVLQLASAGCSVATCDLRKEAADETVEAARAAAPEGIRVSAHRCDVSNEASVQQFRDELLDEHAASSINLLINNAGIAGAGSFLTDDRDAWERVFNVCWGGVYHCTRAFMPLLVASDGGCLVNMSSVNAFWVTHGSGAPSTAYGPAKAAVKGFSEALIEDLRSNAPHVSVAVVMPGSIGTGIGNNSAEIIGEGDAMDGFREILTQEYGLSVEGVSEEEIRRLAVVQDEVYTEFASTSAAEAAAVILGGVLAGRWRILVGADALQLDEAVRADPEAIYDADFPGLAVPPWLMPIVMLRMRFGPSVDPEFRASFEVRWGAERIAINIGDGRADAARGEASEPDAVLEVDPQTLYDLVVGTRGLVEAESAGLVVSGDRAKLERLLASLSQVQ